MSNPFIRDDDGDDAPVVIDWERNAWMNIQRGWLRSDYAKHLRRVYGWTSPFLKHTTITLADVRDRPLPNWHTWMREHTEYAAPAVRHASVA
jgi:hypothetical protein